MDLLVFNMSNFLDWEEGVVNRNFFIVQELIHRPEIERVILVDFLSIQCAKKNFGRRRTFKYARKIRKDLPVKKFSLTHRLVKLEDGVLKTDGKPVYVFEGLGLLKPKLKVLKYLQKVIHYLNVDSSNLLLWSYNPLLPEVFEWESKTSVFDAVDDWSKHPSYQDQSAQLKANYQEINKVADKIFTVSDELREIFSTSKAAWIPNGVDTQRFVQMPIATNNVKPVIGYVGTIQNRLDFDLIEYLCQEHEDKNLLFIGPIWKDVRRRARSLEKTYENITFVGRQPYAVIPYLLGKIDITIIPHRVDKFLKSMNPMKMYDYLAAGKPIVTTPGAGTEIFADILSIQSSKEGFSQAITAELQKDSPERCEDRKKAVQEHNWAKRVDSMLNLLQ